MERGGGEVIPHNRSLFTRIRRYTLACAGFVFVACLILWHPLHAGASTFTVTDYSDTPMDTSSLRYAVNNLVAGTAANTNTIKFGTNCPTSGPITLSSGNGTLTLTQGVTIDGSGHTVVVDGGYTGVGTGVTVFVVNSGVTATINALAIQHGFTALRDGGGIANFGTVTVTNSTLSGNSAGVSGGGIFNFSNGTVTVTNTIITNSPTGGNCSGAITDGGHNLQFGDTSCGGAIRDPLLGPLGNYGGPTQTLPLLPGSPAIDAGTNTGCPATDQRGITRPVNGACDIGAFESQGFTLAVSGGNGQSTVVNTLFPQALSVTVAPNNSGEPVANGVVTYTVTPASNGAGLQTSPLTATITGTTASVSATANGTVGGPYTVTASATGATNAPFTLTNALAVPVVNTSGDGPANAAN